MTDPDIAQRGYPTAGAHHPQALCALLSQPRTHAVTDTPVPPETAEQIARQALMPGVTHLWLDIVADRMRLDTLADCLLTDPTPIRHASVAIVMTADLRAAERQLFLDAGMLIGRIHLLAGAHGLCAHWATANIRAEQLPQFRESFGDRVFCAYVTLGHPLGGLPDWVRDTS